MRISVEVLSGPTDGEVYSFKNSFNIGRDTSANLPLPLDRFVSRHHAQVLISDANWVLEDLNSTNGTFIDDKRVQGRIILNNGQIVKIGRTWVQFNW